MMILGWPWLILGQCQICSRRRLYGKKWKCLISYKPFKWPPSKPYILVFLFMRHIQWHGHWVPRGNAPPHYFIEGIMSQKPYIFVFLVIRDIQWHRFWVPEVTPHPLSLHIRRNRNHLDPHHLPIYIFVTYVKMHSMTETLGPPGACPIPSFHKKALYLRICSDPHP